MELRFQEWRRQKGLTQADAANALGVSQAYLSLLEAGKRPWTERLRGRLETSEAICDEKFSRDLAALGYPPFSHLKDGVAQPSPDALLLAILSKPDADARVVAGLPWLVAEHGSKMDFEWLVRQAKLRNLQNRLGYILDISRCIDSRCRTAVEELAQARLLREDTMCWDSMPLPTREWMRNNRSAEAVYWNVLTRMDS